MSSKTKAVVAVFIVAGILGLIIFDLAMAPGKPKPNSPAATTQAPANDTGEQVIKLLGGETTPTSTTPLSAPAPENQAVQKGVGDMPEGPATPPANEEYEVKQGDSCWSIAKKKYGDGAYMDLIVKANPGIDKDRALTIGRKLILPPKPASTMMKGANEISTNSKVHTVEVGESLSTISQKYFKTVKYAKAIYDANKELIKSPDRLKVGLQIIIPNLNTTPAPAPAPAAAAPETPQTPPPADAPAKRVHKVASGDSLWKIAAKYDAKHVNEMIEKIVQANRDKLESEDTMLKAGWELVIPESR